MEENTKKCPFCAEIINAEAIKCKHCGSDLDTAKVGVLKNQKGSYKNKTTAGLLALFLGTFGAHKF